MFEEVSSKLLRKKITIFTNQSKQISTSTNVRRSRTPAKPSFSVSGRGLKKPEVLKIKIIIITIIIIINIIMS